MAETCQLERTARAPRRPRSFALPRVRDDVLEFCARRRDRDGRCGAYRMAPRERCDLYSSCDVAIMRTIMGEDLRATLPAAQRMEWCEHINSFARHDFGEAGDGSYGDTMGHSALHANGMVIGALGVLEGWQAHPVRLYDDFAPAERIGPWLDSLDWRCAWRTSHLFWGGVHCFSRSVRATMEWLEAAFAWLNRNLDVATGWWRAGTAFADRHQGLGGAAHLWPLYEHHGWEFPMPERVIDSVLALQRPGGSWLEPRPAGERRHVMHYLELDALYGLALMRRFAPDYRRADIAAAAERYGRLVRNYYERHAGELYTQHPHVVLAAVGVFGALQRLLPDVFTDAMAWTGIFSDRRFYRTCAVERL
ncbi:MAG TPA: hypothetical protein VG710_17425 [Opitutus sp.]|nr:hypothetical protein [Opitutus sp.]